MEGVREKGQLADVGGRGGHAPGVWNEEQFEACINALADCVAVFRCERDASGKIVEFRCERVNAAACRDNALAAWQQVGRTLCELFPWGHCAALLKELVGAVERGSPLELDGVPHAAPAAGPGGELRQMPERFIQVRAVPVENAVALSWRAAPRTEQELRERVDRRTDELRQLSDALSGEVNERRRAEQRLRSLGTQARCILWDAQVEGLPGWEQDVDGSKYRFRWQFAIPDEEAAQRVLPLEVPEGMTYARAWLFARHPQDRPGADRAGAEALTRGKLTYSHEFRTLDRYGRDRWLFEDVYIEHLSHGRWRLVGVCTDVTAIHDMQRELGRANEQLRAAHEMLERRVEKRTAQLQRTMESLAESEARFRAFFDSASVGFAASEPATGRFLRVNERMCRITGYTRDELLKMSFFDITHPHDVGENREKLEDLASGELREYTLEKRYLRKDGQSVWVNVEVSLVRDAHGQPLYTVGVIQDITARKAAEEARRQSEQRFRWLFESNMLGICFVDAPSGQVVQANDAYLELIGHRREELETGRLKWMEYTAPEYLPVQEAAFRAARETGRMRPFEKEYLRSDGRRVPVLVGGAVDEHRETVVAFVLDLTERRAAEAALRDSEARLRLALKAAQMGTWDVELPGAVVIGSEGTELLFGFARGEGPVGVAGYLERVVPEDRQRTRRWIEGAMRRGGEQALEFRVLRDDGDVRWLAARGEVVRGAQGEPVRMTGVLMDVTERKAAEAELARAKEAAEAASRSKDQFLAALSHELRTPLTPVLLTVESRLRSPDIGEDLREDLEAIESSVALQARLIDDLLDLTRVARQKLELRCQAVDVHALARQVLRAVGPDLREKRLELNVEMQAGQQHVWGDPARLQQVLGNVLRNAVKFTPAGGCVTVRTSNRFGRAEGSVDETPKPRLVIEVRDTGIGIEPQVLQRIFEVFEQGDRSITKRFGGLGLGLSICKSLVELHGGKVSAASEGAGKGATFAIELPLIQAPEPAAESGESAGPAAEADASRQRNLRVLLVEDHEMTARSLRRLLMGLGHEVHWASGVQAALEFAEHESYDLVISDLGLPDGSGHDLMKQLVARHALRGIALSGYGMREDLDRSQEAGFFRHLVKPVDLDGLQAAIREAVKGA